VTLTEDRDRIGNELAVALERHELDVWYQPEVDVGSGRVVALEALLRWHHPSGELYEAGRFVGVAEDTGLIVGIGAWALSHACTHAVTWRTLLGRTPPVLRVNLSEREVADPGLLAALDAALATGVAPEGLSLELAETALLPAAETPTVAANLRGIHDRGVALVVDRFGVGDGSLGLLRDLPVSVLKLDRGVVARITDDAATRGLVAAVVAAAAVAGVEVIVQGVEEQSQADALTELGLTSATGYLFSGAVPAASISELLMLSR
jgi:EAL domain-containing protein (putative c-di-GMP-specific phosphodiesterase class I)